MIEPHVRDALANLGALASGAGGGQVLVHGDPPLYAGLRRAAADTLLEATLTWVRAGAWERAILFTGRGRHLPKLRIDERVIVGVTPAAWYWRGEAPAPAVPEPPRDEWSLDVASLMRDRGARAGGRLKFVPGSWAWPERISQLLDALDDLRGVRWTDQHRPSGAPAPRALAVIDEDWLTPPWANMEAADVPNPAQRETLRHRLEHLDEAPGPVDIVVLCTSAANAASLQRGEIPGQTGETARAQPTFPAIRLARASVVGIPPVSTIRARARAFPQAPPRLPLYEVLRSHPPRPPEGPMQELERLPGLPGVKRQVRGIHAQAEDAANRARVGLPPMVLNFNTVFYGSPGTGKTTVARILARVFSSFGLLPTASVLEVERADLVGAYQGHTEERTREVCQRAAGGVLFIDEAYLLDEGEGDTFGRLAIGTLLRWLSEHRQELVVIVAGYTERMRAFLRSNAGLAGRFQHHVVFDDYSDGELVEVARSMATKAGDVLDDEVDPVIRDRVRRIREACVAGRQAFRNAGEVERLMQAAREQRAFDLRGRVPDREALTRLTAEHFRRAELDIAGGGGL